MKQILMLFVFSMSLFNFSGCSSDDSDGLSGKEKEELKAEYTQNQYEISSAENIIEGLEKEYNLVTDPTLKQEILTNINKYREKLTELNKRQKEIEKLLGYKP